MAQNQTDPKSSENLGGSREIAYLAFAALPISIYALAVVIFEQGNFGSMAMELKLAAIDHATKSQSALVLFIEGRFRILWLTSVLLYDVIAVAVIVTGTLVLKSSLTSKGLIQALVIWMVLSCFELIHLAYAASHNMAFGEIFRFTFESLQHVHRFKALELAHIRDMVYIVNLLAAIAPFAIALAASASLMPIVAADARRALQRVADRSQQLKSVINLGSALLVVGVLHMQAWTRWPIVFVEDDKLAAAMTNWSVALATFFGCVFSLMIASIYVCCAKILANRAKSYLQQLPADTLDSSVENWLAQHGFSFEPTQQIPQILAILAPLLASPVGAAVSGIGSSIGH
jgi:hypothetical protein